MAAGDAEQGAERGVPGSAAVEAEDELVEIGLQMLAAQAVVDTQRPDFATAAVPGTPRSAPYSALPLATHPSATTC